MTKCGPVSQIGDPDCLGFQYTKIYKMRIKATLSNLVGDTNTDNRFTIIIGPDCTDSILTVIPSGDQTYYIQSTENSSSPPLPIQNFFKQSNPAGCGMDCTLFPDTDASIYSFNSETAEVIIQTDDKSLHDTVLPLNIFCINPRSASAASVDFSVTFRDPCYDATLTLPPLPTTFTSTLWQESFTAFSPALTDTTGCGTPTYVITGLDDPPHYVETRLTQTGLVSLPFDVADAGITTFSVKACYIFAGTQVCSDEQTNLQMEVINPCPLT